MSVKFFAKSAYFTLWVFVVTLVCTFILNSIGNDGASNTLALYGLT